MADNDSRTSRRDSFARDGNPLTRDSDPLAELARLIGQSDPRGVRGRGAVEAAQRVAEPAPTTQLDWAAAEEYVQRSQDARDSYVPPRTAADAAEGHSGEDRSWQYDRGEQESAPQYSPPFAFDDHSRENGHQEAHAAQSLAYVSPLHAGNRGDEDEGYGRQAHAHAGGDDAHDEYEEDASPSRRRAAIVIVALLGLVVVGTAGAFGYRAMFGGSFIPGLPPIIKPGNTPIKIVPNKEAAGGTASQPNAGDKATGDQLVSHEEKPVDIQAANPMPRVVTTIPVVSNLTLPSDQPPGGRPPGPTPPPASQPAPPPALAASNPPPAQVGAAPDQLTGPPSAMSPSGSKPVHTVIIKPGQQQSAASPAPAAQSPPRPARVHQAVGRPSERTASAGPLSIVPGQEGRQELPPPPRTRTAMTRETPATRESSAPMSLSSAVSPAEEAPAPRGGGYAVQVSSQRSESEAQAAYRSLQARYPSQLGGRHAVFRRADLGAKGVYYRALVGPFASGEQAVSLCKSLKAAGGSCIIQRD